MGGKLSFMNRIRQLWRMPERMANAERLFEQGISEEISTREQLAKEMHAELERMEKCNADVRNVLAGELDDKFEQMLTDGEKLHRLHTLLSTHGAVWGDPSRLHVADSAAVGSCLLNVNSGSITIGEYSFAGSNVSILAGSHDMTLIGFVRRDCELTEGCDITIGNGVWLGSNCVILGPCTIGDNAVIASGAVVLPGTTVPGNTVFAGVPAKKVKEISFEDQQQALKNAAQRCGGKLFLDGWKEKELVLMGTEYVTCHRMKAGQAQILMGSKEPASLTCFCPECGQVQLAVRCGEFEETVCVTEKSTTIQLPEGESGRIIMLSICGDMPQSGIFVR